MSLTYRERRTAKIVGATIGMLLSVGLLIVAPMTANYRCHGSVFLPPGDTNHEHPERRVAPPTDRILPTDDQGGEGT